METIRAGVTIVIQRAGFVIITLISNKDACFPGGDEMGLIIWAG
jgi:hypothetical protein